MQIPKQVLVTDVVARDGFQNEDRIVSTQDKLRVIAGLVRAGVTSIEVTSFVHPDVVPQLADAADLVAQLPRHPGVTYSALVPNIKGARRALDAGVTELHLVVKAHEVRLNVWDVPSAIVAGERFKFLVGIKCSAGCNLAGREFGIFDREGCQHSAANLGNEIWPGGVHEPNRFALDLGGSR